MTAAILMTNIRGAACMTTTSCSIRTAADPRPSPACCSCRAAVLSHPHRFHLSFRLQTTGTTGRRGCLPACAFLLSTDIKTTPTALRTSAAAAAAAARSLLLLDPNKTKRPRSSDGRTDTDRVWSAETIIK